LRSRLRSRRCSSCRPRSLGTTNVPTSVQPSRTTGRSTTTTTTTGGSTEAGVTTTTMATTTTAAATARRSRRRRGRRRRRPRLAREAEGRLPQHRGAPVVRSGHPGQGRERELRRSDDCSRSTTGRAQPACCRSRASERGRGDASDGEAGGQEDGQEEGEEGPGEEGQAQGEAEREEPPRSQAAQDASVHSLVSYCGSRRGRWG
jgi:hypothetical protein